MSAERKNATKLQSLRVYAHNGGYTGIQRRWISWAEFATSQTHVTHLNVWIYVPFTAPFAAFRAFQRRSPYNYSISSMFNNLLIGRNVGESRTREAKRNGEIFARVKLQSGKAESQQFWMLSRPRKTADSAEVITRLASVEGSVPLSQTKDRGEGGDVIVRDKAAPYNTATTIERSGEERREQQRR